MGPHAVGVPPEASGVRVTGCSECDLKTLLGPRLQIKV